MCCLFHGAHGKKGQDSPERNPFRAAQWFITINQHDSSWWFRMTHRHDASSWCIMTTIDDSSWCITMNHYDSSWWTIITHHHDTPWSFVMHHDVQRWWWWLLWWCLMTHHDELWWLIMVNHIGPQPWIIMIYQTEVSCFIMTNQHDASWRCTVIVVIHHNSSRRVMIMFHRVDLKRFLSGLPWTPSINATHLLMAPMAF